MTKHQLLIDRLYRDTFSKRQNNPGLRDNLINARRFVMDDTMTEFLTDLVFETFNGRLLGQEQRGRVINWPNIQKRTSKMLDEMRHFSRLPHRITWVEYSHQAAIRRMLQLANYHDLDYAADLKVIPPHAERTVEMSKGVQIGWLMRQIDNSETAFDCSTFIGSPPTMDIR